MAEPFAFGPSGAVLKQIEQGDVDIGAIAEDIVRRSPQAAISKWVANQPLIRSFAKSATAGLSEPVAAGLSAIAAKTRYDDGSLGEIYKRIRGRQQATTDKMNEEHGGQTLAGNILGTVAPGGAFSRIYSVTKKATNPLVKGGEALMKGGVPSKIGGWLTKYAVAPFLRGGTSQLAYEGVNPESRAYKDADYARNAFLFGGLGDAGGEVGMQALKGGAAGIKGIGHALWKGMKSTPMVGGFVEGLEEGAKKKAAEAFKEGAEGLGKKVGAESPMVAGEGFREGVDDLYDDMFREYKKVVDPAMKRFADQPASAKNLREKIMSVLDQAGAVDPKGNIDFDALPFAGPDASGYKALAKYSDALKNNRSLAELERLVKSFGKEANFKGGHNRTEIQRVYGDLFGSGRDDMMDAIEGFVTQAQKGGAQYRGAQKALENSLELADEYAGQIKKPLTGERMKAVLQEGQEGATQKAMAAKENLAGLDQAAEDSGELTAELIRQARKKFSSTKGVLDTMRNIAGKTPEAIVQGASSRTIKTGLPGSEILKAIETVPELRGPIAKVVMGNILSKASDPKALMKAVKNWDQGALSELFGPEVMDALVALGGEAKKKGAGAATQALKKWAVSNPQAARPSLWLPRVMLNNATKDSGETEEEGDQQ